MNRRKFLLGTAGIGLTGVAIAKTTTDRFCKIEVAPEGIEFVVDHWSDGEFMLDAEEFRNLAISHKIRWVKTTDLHTVGKGWKEHPWHITRFEGNGLAHLMVTDG